MSCFYPFWRNISGEFVKVPCGRCRGCRLDRAKEWALRCVNEATMHEENCFVTLTYRDEDLPEDGSIRKEELSNFMRKLRKKIKPRKVRFYGCGEYGKKYSRPHYHVLLFGWEPTDKVVKYIEKGKRNRFSSGDSYAVYVSPFLSKVWRKGFHSIGEVNFESAGYCARYIGKKLGGAMAKAYEGREPEFALMSRRPGIGSSWIEKYMYDIYPKDFTTYGKKKFKSCRYYDNRLKRHCWPMYEDVRIAREEKAKNPDCVRRRQKEKYLINVTKILERSYENDDRKGDQRLLCDGSESGDV